MTKSDIGGQKLKTTNVDSALEKEGRKDYIRLSMHGTVRDGRTTSRFIVKRLEILKPVSLLVQTGLYTFPGWNSQQSQKFNYSNLMVKMQSVT